jgi:hypothetical protein
MTTPSTIDTARSSRRSNKPEANWFFFSGHEESTVQGLRFLEEVDPNATHSIALPTISIGPTKAQWRKIIRALLGDSPLYDQGKVWRGSIIKDPSDPDGKKDVMVGYRDENANYALVRTGVRAVDRGGAVSKANFWTLLAERGITQGVTHGGYSFDREAVQSLKTIRVATADDVEQIAAGKLKDIMTDPNSGIGRVAAEKVGLPISIGRQIKGLGCPESAFVLWRMPFGSVLLVRDVDGRMSRLVSTKSGVRRVDANNREYAEFFDAFDKAYRAAVVDLRAQKASGDKAASA